MTKKKYYTYISISLLIVYSLFISMIVGVSVKENNRQEEEASQYVQHIKSPEFLEKYNKKDKLDDYIYDHHITPYYNTNTNKSQPMLLMIFDSDKNIVASSGSYVELNFIENNEVYKTEYCNIDKFLTDDMIKQIFISSEKNNYPLLKEFDYNIENGKIIPVKMELNNSVNDLTLTFSDDVAEYSLKNDLKDESNFANLYLENINPKDNNYKSYKELRNYAYSETFLSVLDGVIKEQKNVANEEVEDTNNELDFPSIATTTGYENIGIYISSMEIENEQYYFVKLLSFNPIKDIFGSNYFKSLTIQYTLIFAILATIVIAVADKIYNKNQQLEIARKSFINAAAHELKTPLAIISNQCECIMENVSPEKNIEYVNSIYDESKRMTRLVKTLIYYNKVSSVDTVNKEFCNLKDLAQNELNKYQILFDNKNISIETDLKVAEIACNKELISLVIDNFLSNALKYTEENCKVKISTGIKKNIIGLAVFNEGAKIDEEDGAHIWEELYRADKARTSNSDSTGMGLALSRKILELHGFTYDYRNLENGVEFYFYKKN